MKGEISMLLSEILGMRGIDISKVKVVRHTINRPYMQDLMQNGLFDLYQSIQTKNRFSGCKYIVSFTDMERNKVRLYGVYSVDGSEYIKSYPLELENIARLEKWDEPGYYSYTLRRINILNDLEERLVIDWGGSTLSWCQSIVEKDVVEIFPQGYVDSFPGYQKVILSFDRLQKIANNPDANRQWKVMLSNVYGVYLIVDTSDGKQCVGSAYGKDRIWGRWLQYVSSHDGGNTQLTELLKSDSSRYRGLSVQHTLCST